MASKGKRMVNEDLIKKLENLPEGLEVVEANSTDEATETLTKLTVGDTVYSVPQGGGGSALYYVTYKISDSAEAETADWNMTFFVPIEDLQYQTDTDIPATYTLIGYVFDQYYTTNSGFKPIVYDPSSDCIKTIYDYESPSEGATSVPIVMYDATGTDSHLYVHSVRFMEYAN